LSKYSVCELKNVNLSYLCSGNKKERKISVNFEYPIFSEINMAEDAEDSVTVKEEELEEDEDGRSEANFSPVFIVPSSKEDELPRYQY
jgi:hypothetical protein